MARRHASDRVFRDRSTDADDGEDQVANLSATPGDPGMSRHEDVGEFKSASTGRRISATSPPRPGTDSPRVGHRTPVEIDAETGQELDETTEKATARAVRRLSISDEVERSHPSARPMLEHVFGLNLPGRDRA